MKYFDYFDFAAVHNTTICYNIQGHEQARLFFSCKLQALTELF